MTPPPESQRPGDHEIYLLRIWYEIDGNRAVWRASVRQPYDEQRRHFASPDRLLAYLRDHVIGPEAGGDGHDALPRSNTG